MVPRIAIAEYSLDGRSPFREWHDRLDAQAAAAVSVAIGRLADGNISNVKSIGEGAAELKINRGPGYGSVLVILLGGGTKQRQQTDISVALRRWRDYKARKRSEG
ncbi:type II toxin-antitoxin system RelE/ParE family toxin [Bradyrhizobium guangxiense]